MSNQKTAEQDPDFFSDTGEHLLDFTHGREVEAVDPVTKAQRKIPGEIVRCIVQNIFNVPGSIDRGNPAHTAVVAALEEKGIEIPDSADNPDAVPEGFYRDSTPTQSSRIAEA